MMGPRATLMIGVAIGAAVLSGATWLIHRNYQAALRHELEDSNGQVGQLRVQAEGLRIEQATRSREIAAIRAEIAAAEAALANAKRKAEESRCQAIHARMDAAVTAKQVGCYQQFARQAECMAAHERARADSTLLGALIGAGIAMASGGSSLLLTAGGGIIGSSGGGGPCPAPTCELNTRLLRFQVLREQGLQTLPPCETPYEAQFLISSQDVADDPLPDPRNAARRRPAR
jgi:hypothetical protein